MDRIHNYTQGSGAGTITIGAPTPTGVPTESGGVLHTVIIGLAGAAASSLIISNERGFICALDGTKPNCYLFDCAYESPLTILATDTGGTLNWTVTWT